jgi:hypothetical protein
MAVVSSINSIAGSSFRRRSKRSKVAAARMEIFAGLRASDVASAITRLGTSGALSPRSRPVSLSRASAV